METIKQYTVNSEPIEGLEEWIAENEECGFSESELVEMRTLEAGESMVLGGGAWGEFVLGRES